ncbi:MAG TPA: putative glycoside hydrolase, partial [Allosphingosinicella sp.]
VAGDGADNIAKQSGGWTITWQGPGLTNADFPGATSIFAGIRDAVRGAGGRATLSPDGSFSRKPDVAIVVFGEDPYAEFVGDRPRTLEFSPADKKHLDLLRKLKAADVPVVAVFLSGRPMWVNPELNASDAFVAAFLPGSEGAGIADVLFRDASGRVRHDFKGRLSYSWPRRADQTPLNRGDAAYDPLFAYGHGLTYRDKAVIPRLPEERPAGSEFPDGVFFARGALPPGWTFAVGGEARTRRVDRRAQEDAIAATFTGTGPQTLRLLPREALDISREATGELSLLVDYRVDSAPTGRVTLSMACGEGCAGTVPVKGLLAGPSGEWRTMTVPLRCFVQAGLDPGRVQSPFTLATSGRLELAVSDIRIASATVDQQKCAWD